MTSLSRKYYRLSKDHERNRTFYEKTRGIQHMYYTGSTRPIIATYNKVEYWFDSLTIARKKFGHNLVKGKTYREVTTESKDDFMFELETGLYRRDIQ